MEVKSSYKVFVTMLRRYGLRPYRYHCQRYTTVMIQVPERFVTETLWPEFRTGTTINFGGHAIRKIHRFGAESLSTLRIFFLRIGRPQ